MSAIVVFVRPLTCRLPAPAARHPARRRQAARTGLGAERAPGGAVAGRIERFHRQDVRATASEVGVRVGSRRRASKQGSVDVEVVAGDSTLVIRALPAQSEGGLRLLSDREPGWAGGCLSVRGGRARFVQQLQVARDGLLPRPARCKGEVERGVGARRLDGPPPRARAEALSERDDRQYPAAGGTREGTQRPGSGEAHDHEVGGAGLREGRRRGDGRCPQRTGAAGMRAPEGVAGLLGIRDRSRSRKEGGLDDAKPGSSGGAPQSLESDGDEGVASRGRPC